MTMPKYVLENERKNFEDWIYDHLSSVPPWYFERSTRDNGKDYVSDRTQARWEAWLARANLSAPIE